MHYKKHHINMFYEKANNLYRIKLTLTKDNLVLFKYGLKEIVFVKDYGL